MFRASGLGRACVDDICGGGGYAAILDLNEELASAAVEKWAEKAKFFDVNVLETESVSKAVNSTLAWVQSTGKELGGVIAAAGVSNPAKVRQISLNGAFLTTLFPRSLTATSHLSILIPLTL